MKSNLTAFVAGVVFAVGLAVAGMTDANKVIAFLDVAGDWDPSLAFVMGGAIAVHAVAYQLLLPRQPKPVFALQFALPTRPDVDLRLLGGAALFGVGWGLGGICPGPGLVSLAGGGSYALVFLGAMVAGMIAFHKAHDAWTLRQEAREDRAAEPVR